MKKSISLCFIVLLSCFSLSVSAREKGTRATYSLQKNEADKSLKPNEAAFTITFLLPNDKPVTTNIKLSHNGVNATLCPDAKGQLSFIVKPGKNKLRFFLSSDYFEITTDSIAVKTGYRATMEVYFSSSVNPVICDKPVIYVYPRQTMPVNITLDFKGKLGLTYPAYDKGWSFTADPNGTIHMGDKKYHYLFWDGGMDAKKLPYNTAEGYFVRKDSLVPFFERTLKQMGLHPNEIEDYITYWVPRMSVNEVNFVHFLFNEECNAYAKLHVTPQPDNLCRVFMLWSVSDVHAVVPQKIETFKRDGFTVVEWGGAEMSSTPVKIN